MHDHPKKDEQFWKVLNGKFGPSHLYKTFPTSLAPIQHKFTIVYLYWRLKIRVFGQIFPRIQSWPVRIHPGRPELQWPRREWCPHPVPALPEWSAAVVVGNATVTMIEVNILKNNMVNSPVRCIMLYIHKSERYQNWFRLAKWLALALVAQWIVSPYHMVSPYHLRKAMVCVVQMYVSLSTPWCFKTIPQS